MQQAYLVNRMFRRIEANGDGELTREEFNKFFDAAARGKDRLLSEDLRDALLGGNTASFLPGDAPSSDMLIRGVFAGEVGSLNEGPGLNSRAPDFSLMTHDGTKTVRLADLIGKKPVVITFGNFTCGPFRSMFPGVEEVHKRFADEATFIAVYVREAHPTDGWKMESNNRVGVAVAQPKTFAERVAVASQCHRLLKPAMPLLVDEINDPVGHAYSGMPARLYVIDREGNVAYKSGRGPFGFKSGEMEQALVMTLLEQKQATETAAKQPAK
ncbi:MAG: Iodothyronine deiodinase [Planctomycetaceae bacterium]|nr:Iodothyronine deiodinase [Planctomycetaceae bacterium]